MRMPLEFSSPCDSEYVLYILIFLTKLRRQDREDYWGVGTTTNSKHTESEIFMKYQDGCV